MNNKKKIALLLFSIASLSACNDKDSSTKNNASNTESEYTDTVDITDNSIEEVEENKVLNGSFENWSNNVPDSWTTIDTGISILENKEIYHSGLNSAEVSVNTKTQNSTDLRQYIEVTSGTSYKFSAWIFHTEGAVAARLYVGNFETYSDENLVNEWQEVTYSYTADEDKKIEVGLRFYDKDGFDAEEIVYIDDLSFSVDTDTENLTTDTSTDDGSTTSEGSSSNTVTNSVDTTTYYSSVTGLTGLELKTALYSIIKDHTVKTYGDLWTFMGENSLDTYYENDGSILDMYSENPSSSETYNYIAITDQCGNFSGEGSCYNREHSFPKSWFDGKKYPMYTDIHHIFATDGYVNGRRSNYPYGEVDTATFVSDNGSKLGSATSSLGYTGTVFEPIDEFKGDFARAYFYMATRYEDIISTWENNSDNAAAVLDGTSDYVYEEWVIDMLKTWNESDPVSQKELDRNDAAYEFQGNRNPFIDHPEYVNQIWAD